MQGNDNENSIDKRFIDWYGTQVYTNICHSCINRIVIPHKTPECNVFGKIPFEFLTAEKSDCPYYKLKPDAKPGEMPYTKEDEKAGKPWPEIPKEPGKVYLKYDEGSDKIRYYTVDEKGQERGLTEAEEKELDEKTMQRIRNLGNKEEEK